MPKKLVYNKFNRGEIDDKAIAREDFEKVVNSASEMTNFLPSRLGGMQYRPGFEYVGDCNGSTQVKLFPFTRSVSDQAIFEFTNNALRVWIADTTTTVPAGDALVDRESVLTALPSDMSQSGSREWRDVGDSGTTTGTTANKLVDAGQNFLTTVSIGATVFNSTDSTYAKVTAVDSDTQLSLSADIMTTTENYTISGGYSLSGADVVSSTQEIYQQTTGDAGYTWSSVTVSSGDSIVEHGIDIVISKAPCEVYIGTANAVYSKDLYDGVLKPGTHRLVVTPRDTPGTTRLTVTFANSELYGSIIDSCAIASSGTMSLTTAVATADLRTMRMVQVNDICYFTYDNGQHFQVERRGIKSWSIVDSWVTDGPFETINISDITMYPSALTGGTEAIPVTVTASRDYFVADHVGSLIKITSAGQEATATQIGAGNTDTGSILVIGTGLGRKFQAIRSKTDPSGSSTITLQSSVDESSWTDVKTYTDLTTTDNYNDGLDGQDVFYRLHLINDGTPTDITGSLIYPGGGIDGIGKILVINSATNVDVSVLSRFGKSGSGNAVTTWYEGTWSTKNGFPTAVKTEEGRLCYAGKGDVWLSVSDTYDSFSRETTGVNSGDSASIFKTMAFAAGTSIYWLASAIRLIAGTAMDAVTVRSSSFNEILTPDNCNLKAGAGYGSSASCSPLELDDSLYYVSRSGQKIIQLDYNGTSDGTTALDLMTIHPYITAAAGTIATGEIFGLAMTRHPETKLWANNANGNMSVYTVDQAEEVSAWSRITHAGNETIDDVITLPGTTEDRVYIVTKNSSVYSLCKLAPFDSAIGGTASHNVDMFEFQSSTTDPVTVGAQIANSTVVRVWANGVDLGEFTTDGSNQITLGGNKSNVTIGLPYNGDYASNKMSGTSYSLLSDNVKVDKVGMIVRDTVLGALQTGPSYANLFDIPYIDTLGATQRTVAFDVDELPMPFDGSFTTDSRVHLRAKGPCTILALTYLISEGDAPKKSDK